MNRGIVAFLLCFSLRAVADPVPPSWDEDRLGGFGEHQTENKIFDREREKGRNAYLEGLEQAERERLAARDLFRKNKKTQKPAEETSDYTENVKAREAQLAEQEKIRAAYVREKQAILARRHHSVAVTPMEELGLDQTRPRYDVRHRALYGNGKLKSSHSSSGGGGGGSYQPPMDEGPTANSGMMPPPPPPAEFDEMPPPPPPMPAPSFEDGGGADFPPPPSPDFNDFPPPPPPPPEGL